MFLDVAILQRLGTARQSRTVPAARIFVAVGQFAQLPICLCSRSVEWRHANEWGILPRRRKTSSTSRQATRAKKTGRRLRRYRPPANINGLMTCLPPDPAGRGQIERRIAGQNVRAGAAALAILIAIPGEQRRQRLRTRMSGDGKPPIATRRPDRQPLPVLKRPQRFIRIHRGSLSVPIGGNVAIIPIMTHYATCN